MPTRTAERDATGSRTAAEGAAGTSPRSRSDVWWLLPGAAIGGLVIWAAHRGLIDDAYISLAYARNVATDLHWGIIPTAESNTATSPLNVLLLALCTWLLSLVTGDVRPVLALCVLTVVLSAALTGWAAQTARRLGVPGAWSIAVLVVVLANPFVNSALGLEVLPLSALLTGLLAQAVRGRAVAAGVLAGLLVLTRLDLGVVVAVVYLLSPALRRRWWVTPAVASAVALPWFAFSWWHFGSAIPTTFVIKTLQRSFGDHTFANGLWTLWAPRGWVPLALALGPAAAGLVTVAVLLAAAAARRLPEHRWPVAALGLGGAAYFAAYALLGVPPYQWYYVPTTVSLGLAGVFGLALALRRAVPAGRTPAVRAAAPVGTALLLAGLAVVSLEGRPVPWSHPVYFGSFALPGDYRAIGADVGRLVGDGTVRSPGEIGTLAYACDCAVSDVFSDPGRTLPLVERRIGQAGPVGRFLLELNFARLDRDVRPLPLDHVLAWTQEGSPPAVRTWTTHSPATGPATVYLQAVG